MPTIDTNRVTNAQQDLADSSLRYDYKLQELDESTHYGRLLNRVGRNKRVLELGSSTGFLTDAMINHFACQVVGVEIDSDAAKEARAKGHEVHVLDLDKTDLSEHFKGQKFDVALLADVLEHLRDPAETLKQIKGLLSPNGKIVSSIPHVAHGDIRLSLLTGRLPYRAVGLLDHTHMRFFTRALVEQLFKESGYNLDIVERNRWNLNKTEVKFDYVPLLEPVQKLLALDPESETYQFIAQASLPKAEEQKPQTLPEVEFCVFATNMQKPDELYNKTLTYQSYDPDKLRYWFSQGAHGEDSIALCDKPDIGSLPYGQHDFRSWRFITMGAKDEQNQELNQPAPSWQGITIANVGQTLSRVARGSSASYVFILSAAALPTVHCLERLVLRAEQLKQAGQTAIVCATAEVRDSLAPQPRADGTVDWHEFSGMLIPMEFLKSKESIDSSFISLTTQAQDLCFRAWASGMTVLECPDAPYFTNGPQLEAATVDAQIFDGMRLRRRWGSLRNLIAFTKYTLKNPCGKPLPFLPDQNPGTIKKLNHMIAAYLLESPIGQGQSSEAKQHIGFSGPGATLVGKATI
jgi:2-polyprenyl-3-methyl-5-hydroxy-6-metoxy-1,4-benzoquinol methylase